MAMWKVSSKAERMIMLRQLRERRQAAEAAEIVEVEALEAAVAVFEDDSGSDRDPVPE
jgi:hypothetical protein